MFNPDSEVVYIGYYGKKKEPIIELENGKVILNRQK